MIFRSNKIILIAIGVFIVVLASIFIVNKMTTQNKFTLSNNTKPLLKSDINSPNIDFSTILSQPIESNPDSFTLGQISKHTSKNDCYLIINNNVYNVSSFIIGGYHPAGSRIIISYCGKEITGIFARIHSNRAWDLLKKYKIGTITTSKINRTPQVLIKLSGALKEANPDAEIIKVSPKIDFYIAKIIYNKKLYEVHINNDGQIIKEEIEDAESDWSLWDNDNDD